VFGIPRVNDYNQSLTVRTYAVEKLLGKELLKPLPHLISPAVLA
jgi:hypothetical protein